VNIDIISTPASPGHGCEWCPCTAEEEAAHPEWHDPNRCPRNCTAEAEQTVTLAGPASGAKVSMQVCDEHAVSGKLLFIETLTQFIGGMPGM